ncbi:hypothetical protein NTE28_003573 [Vibrio harveyi]|nr:hypothetical protein [Vibrio harveyi]
MNMIDENKMLESLMVELDGAGDAKIKSVISLCGVDGKTWELGYGVDSSTPNFWLLGYGETLRFIKLSNLIDYIKTGESVEVGNLTHFIVHDSMGGQSIIDHYSYEKHIRDFGIQIDDEMFVRTLPKGQMELIHEIRSHQTMNPECDHIEPYKYPDFEIISDDKYTQLFKEHMGD